MPRPTTSLKDLVVRFYLTAPLQEIEDLQGVLREIYNKRNETRQAQQDGKLKAATAAETKKVKKLTKKNKTAAADAGTGFGGKETVGETAS